MPGGDEWEEGHEPRARPFGVRPFGVRPFGVRSDGEVGDDRPFGVRPFGVRPFGVRPIDERPFGVRPFGVRPFGVRPFGVRPYGARPFGVRASAGGLDPDEWGEDIANLVCERSGVIRLGATLVADEYELRVPAVDATPNAPIYVNEGDEKPTLERRESEIRPRDHELAAKVVLPDRVARDLARNDVLALSVKEDLAEALALRADQAFLAGAGPQPTGIANVVPGGPQGADLLATARALVTAIRTVDPLLNPTFRAPGWVVHPATLDELARIAPGPPGSTVDMVLALLRLDGADAGELLGYPFVVSAAAYDGADRRLFFSADWRQAWIAVGEAVVDVEISTDAHFQTDETVIRATMGHDFVLRRPEAFIWAGDDFPRAGESRSRSRSRSRKSSQK